MSNKILIVEVKKSIAEFIEVYLENEDIIIVPHIKIVANAVIYPGTLGWFIGTHLPL